MVFLSSRIYHPIFFGSNFMDALKIEKKEYKFFLMYIIHTIYIQKNTLKKPNLVASSSGVASATHSTNPLGGRVGGRTSWIRVEGPKIFSILELVKEDIPTTEVVLTPIVEGHFDIEFQTKLIQYP